MGRSMTGSCSCALVALSVFLAGFSLTDGLEERAEFTAGLRHDLVKVDHGIVVTRALIERSAGSDFLPDVLFRLAELHVEKSRLLYYLEVETKGAELAHRSPQALFYKNEALNIYGDLVRRYPAYRHRDKALFCMAHEYEELGLHKDKLTTYLRLVNDFPKSTYLPEVLYLLGEHHFDRDALDEAASFYTKVLAFGESPLAHQARYKLGWVAVNRARLDKRQWAKALRLFEQVARGGERAGELRARAMDGIVFCFTEVRPAADALGYFQTLSDSNTGYVRALSKLANRYFIKEQFDQAAMVYRRIIELSSDAEKNLDYAQRIYDASSLAAHMRWADRDVQALATAIARVAHSWRVPDLQREQLSNQFEVYARDLVTRLHLLAGKRRELNSYRAAARAYDSYLGVFAGSGDDSAIRTNRAEALFNARLYLPAGRAYEDLARQGLDGPDRKGMLYSALQAYQRALAGHGRLGRAERLECRQAIQQLGARFASLYPQDPRTGTVAFNVARALFEQGLYREAAGAFESYMASYPTHTEQTLAGHLILDCHEQLRDYQGMVDKGRALIADPDLGDESFEGTVAARIEQASMRLGDRAVVDAAEQGEDPVSALLKIAKVQQTENLLVRAFDLACKQRDIQQAFSSGATLVGRYPSSGEVPRVYASLSNLSVETADFERAAELNEEFFQRLPGDPRARAALGRAARIRSMLGQHDRAARDYRRLLPRALGPEHADLVLEMARSQAASGRWGAALGAAQQALDLRPDLAGAQLLNAKGLAHQGEIQRAKQAYLAAVSPERGSTTSAEALFRLGDLVGSEYQRVTLRSGQEAQQVLEKKIGLFGAAERLYVEAVERGEPGWSVPALVQLGALHRDLAAFLPRVPVEGSPGERAAVRKAITAQVEKAEETTRETQQLCLRVVREQRVFGPYALACIRQTEPVLAPATRRRAAAGTVDHRTLALRTRLAENPRDGDALVGLARLSLETGDYPLARMQLGAVLELRGKDPTALNLMGVVAWHLGEHQQAMDDFTRAMEADPGLLAARLNQAALLVLYEDLMGARKSLGKHLARASLDLVDLHPSVGSALVRLRRAGERGQE